MRNFRLGALPKDPRGQRLDDCKRGCQGARSSRILRHLSHGRCMGARLFSRSLLGIRPKDLVLGGTLGPGDEVLIL